MFAIYKKEMRQYFTTPLGYVFIAVFLGISGFVFAFTTLQNQTSDVSGYFQMMIFGYIVIVPQSAFCSLAANAYEHTIRFSLVLEDSSMCR